MVAACCRPGCVALAAVAVCRSDSGIVAILETSKESASMAYCGGSVGGSVRCFGGALSAARDDGGGDRRGHRGGHHILTSVSQVLCVPGCRFFTVSCNAKRKTLNMYLVAGFASYVGP